MKTGRRQDPDGLRRIPRERDAAVSRVRKRPSMLSEFQGKYYNHRETSRESGHSRPSHRYEQHDSSFGVKGTKRDKYGPGFFKGDVSESRSSPYARTLPAHNISGLSFQDDVIPAEFTNSHDEGSTPTKRPRLLADMKLDTSIGAVSGPLTGSVTGHSTPSLPTSSPQGPGLSAYLEDIESDEGDLMVDDDEKPSGTPPPEAAPPTPPAASGGLSSQQSKEQLLQKMETVDRDIAATEEQISTLQKRQAELEGSVHSTPSTSTPSPLHPSPLPLSADDNEGAEEDTPPTPPDDKMGSPKRSLLDSVYLENKLKARSAHAVLHHLLPVTLSPAQSASPLYSQPWDAPGYFDIIKRHRECRAQLVQLIQKQKLLRHAKEVALCKKYDAFVADWKKRLEKAENSSKKKTRDLKTRELFERTFPELKNRREQQERLMRVDQRGYGVVRSELELSQVMCELYEQEEAPARSRRTHALIPTMVVGGPEERLMFRSSNGLIQDPMALYRAAKLTNVWSDEEKKTFREKYALYPKNFEAISTFLPSKTTADCVRYYYLHKKNEKFKQMARKATFKRRKFIKPVVDLGGMAHATPRLTIDGDKTKMRSPLLSEVIAPQTPPTASTVTTPTTPGQDERIKEEPLSPKTTRYGDWTDEDISNLRCGLRKWGRAWSKIYREVGGRKTATQCKRFFDDFCHEEYLGLGQALSERSSIKNAEKAQRKVESRRIAAPLARKRAVKAKAQVEPEPERVVEGESEAMESASNCETGSAEEEEEEEEEESGSESTITDSSPEDATTISGHSSVRRSWKSHVSSMSPSHSSQTGSEKGALELFISAAEALNNVVPTEVALHDHNYALAPLNSVDIQGSSGLSLIAAAAAVVSPTLSRSAGSGKFPAVSPVRAPRGRPPNTQRRGSSGSSCKLSPTLLSPAGTSIYVPLTDTTKSSFRSRARSAPSDRPRIQLSRAGPSNLRYSISSKSSSPRPILPPASYTRTKDSSGPASSTGGTPSLKSMIASRSQPAMNSNAAFETLVNVAVAASPAELPKTTSAQPTATLSISFQNTSNSAPATPAAAGTPLTDATYSIDMSQAINILTLAQLAQSPVSTAGNKTPQQLLLTPGVASKASGLLGTIVSQNGHDGGGGGGGVNSPSPGTVNVLIGHLTAGNASPTASVPSEASSTISSPSSYSEPRHLQKPPGKTSKSPAPSPPVHPPSSSTEDLSNLNLLSSLVAVVAGTQAPPTAPSITHTSTSIHSDTTTSCSSAKTTSTTPLPPPPVHSRSSAFKATNLPPSLTQKASSPSLDKKEINTRTKMHDKPSPLPSLVNSEHSPRSPVGNSAPLDSLARSVVRSSCLTYPQPSHSTTNSSPHTHSTYPSPSPSISQQSTLLLYTRSLSLPNPAGTEVSSEEEDHLESATRGISELSKLLGTDSGAESLSGSDSTISSAYRNSWEQGASALPPIIRTSRGPRGGSPGFSTAKSELGNDSSKYLSGLLEAHSSHSTHSQKTNSSKNSTDVKLSQSPAR